MGLCGGTAVKGWGWGCDGLGFSPALMKSCEAVTLDVRGYRSLNCYHTALTPLATGYIPPKQILAGIRNKLQGHMFCYCLSYTRVFAPVNMHSCSISYTCFSLSFPSILHLPSLFNLTLNEPYSITSPLSPSIPFASSLLGAHPIIVLDWRKICSLYLPSPGSF